jgi:hypothetical protein
MMRRLLTIVGLAAPALLAAGAFAQPVLLRDNGAFVTSVGTGFDGADVSQSQVNPTGDGFTYVGLGITESTGSGGPFRNADDFVVPVGKAWDLDRVEYFAFQSQSSGFSTVFAFTEAYVAVYDGPPASGGTLIAGDFTTNRLRGGAWSGAYRTTSGTTGQQSQSRPIMRVDIDLSWLAPLASGRYYFAVSMVGDPLRPSPTVFSVLVTPNPSGASSQRFANVDPFFGWFEAPLEWPWRLFGVERPACNDLDFNNDAVFPDLADVVAFVDVFAGGACPTTSCDSIDFNNDGVFPDTADVATLLTVFAGGEC